MKQHNYTFWLTGGIFFFCLAAISPTKAQIVPDATLPNNSKVTPQGDTSTITGGTRAGSNLFHSFEQFSVPNNGVAFFNNASNIQNIISRVTGSSVSNIDGLISARNPVNLFLLNPNGIIFGPNATLNIGGSFLASTASSINFADGTQFSATAHPTTPLLTVSVPIGLQFGRGMEGNAGSIVNQSQTSNSDGTSGLAVQPGRTLALVGGDVSLDGGISQAPGSRVELGGVAGSGTVGLFVEGNNLRLSYPAGVQRADVLLTNGASVDVTAGGGGSIAISAHNINVLHGSDLVAGIGEGFGSVGTKAGDITLDATGAINIAGSTISNNVASGVMGDGGSIFIKAGSLSLTDNGSLSAGTSGQGNAGSVFVQANNSVSVASSSINTNVEETGAGNGGVINIQTGELSLTDGSQLETSTSGEGSAGNMIIDVRHTVSADESSIISSETFGQKDAGRIDIKARALSLTSGSRIYSRTTGKGNAGNIQVNASDLVSISGVNPQKGFSSGLIAETIKENSGRGGNISVTTGGLRVLDGGVLSARTLNASPGGSISVHVNTLEALNSGQLLTTAFSSGHAGNIDVNAHDSVTLSGSDRTYSNRLAQFGRSIVDPDSPASGLSAQSQGAGAAGNLTIATGRLSVQDGAQVSARTLNQGKGGNITVRANTFDVTNGSQLITTTEGTGLAGDIILEVANNITLSGQGSGLFANTAVGSIGNGGKISIDPNSVIIKNGAAIAVDSQGTGNAGEISLMTNALLLDSGARISAEKLSGQGGNITLQTQDLQLHNNSQITNNAQGQANGGLIMISAGRAGLENSRITSETASGSGGDIQLNAQSLLSLRSNSLISTTAGNNQNGGNGGNITINTPFIIAVPAKNSDISANAFTGNGGQVTINAYGIVGTQFREQPTRESDITASSTGGGVNGEVNLNASLIDPSQGLVALPAEVVDASGLVAQGCAAGDGTTSSQFTATGRGGLPPNPGEVLSTDVVWEDDRLPAVTANQQRSETVTATPPSRPAAVAIVPATGWVFNDKGEVTLTAKAPAATSYNPWSTPTTCR